MRVTSSGSSSSRVARIPMKLEREREWEKRRSYDGCLSTASWFFHPFSMLLSKFTT